MTDNVAVLKGYTVEVIAEYPDGNMFLLVKPNTDFSDTFRAWNMDTQEFLLIDGWRCEITEIPS